MCCHINCCCPNMKRSGLINLLFVFTLINFVLSLTAIFIRAAKTGRYEEALIYLEERNNGTFNNFTFDNCKLGGLFKDTYFCDIYGKRLSKPEKNVEFQSIYKNWGIIELTLNTLRFIFTLLYVIFIYGVIKRGGDGIENTNEENKNKYVDKMKYLIIFLTCLIAVSGFCILIRAFSMSANISIGLYEDGNQNGFEEKIAINYIIDITEIVLYSIEICFAIRLQRIVNQIEILVIEKKIVVEEEKEKEPPLPPQVIINKNIIINQNVSVGESDKTNQNDRTNQNDKSNQNIVGNF